MTNNFLSAAQAREKSSKPKASPEPIELDAEQVREIIFESYIQPSIEERRFSCVIPVKVNEQLVKELKDLGYSVRVCWFVDKTKIKW